MIAPILCEATKRYRLREYLCYDSRVHNKLHDMKKSLSAET